MKREPIKKEDAMRYHAELDQLVYEKQNLNRQLQNQERELGLKHAHEAFENKLGQWNPSNSQRRGNRH